MGQALLNRLGSAVALLAGLGLSCSGSQTAQESSPSLSETRAAQAAFRTLLAVWYSEEESHRPDLEPRMRRFLARYPADPRAANVKALMAWLTLVRGDYAGAKKAIDELRASDSPSVRDFVEVVAARLLLARQEPEAALVKLTALEGKLVDPAERLLCSELRLQAALASRHFSEALVALGTYLAAAPPDLGDRARARAETAIASLPDGTLESALGALDSKARVSALSAPDTWLRRVMRERLIRQAVEHKDGKLARRLLDSHPGLAQNSPQSAALLELAATASAAGDPRGAFVGLALETGDADAERRSASVARGLADALSATLPGADSIPLVVKASDADHVSDALEALSAAGALAIVAGMSDAAADAAATWAVSGKAPVLLIRDTPDLVISEHSFVLGESELDQLDAIRKELERRNLGRWVRVGSGGFDCRATPEKAGQSRFPVRDWKQEGIEAIAILGPRSCALEVYAEAHEQQFAPLLAIALEGSDALPSLTGRRLVLGAGGFPSSVAGGEIPPSFYEALGHDAGDLLRHAWVKLAVPDGTKVEAVRPRLLDALANVTIPLVTTEASGFGGKRRLPRKLVLREGK